MQQASHAEASTVMVITEIFKSIQGEGTRAGLPCIFVRLTGCNLRCTWCDTAYAFHGGKKMTVEEVLARVDELAGRCEGIPEIGRASCRERVEKLDEPGGQMNKHENADR